MKPLNAATGRVLAPYWPGGRHGRRHRRHDEYTKHNYFQLAHIVIFLLAIRENFIPQNGPSTQLIEAKIFVKI